jgi:plasmid stabilization system protein ParE
VRYHFTEAARAEHLEQVAYYEERQRGLGLRYTVAFESSIERVCAHPDRFPALNAYGVRRLHLHGFPFSILYRIEHEEIEVLAVAAHRRKPGYWAARLSPD